MATIAAAPIHLTDITLKIGADNYEAAISSVEFVPASTNVTWKGMTPNSNFTFVTTATWTCNITFAQDLATAASLSNYLMSNEGTSAVTEFVPKKGTGQKKVTATLVLTPGAIGGAGDAVAVASVSLGVLGKPVIAAIA